MSDDRVLTGGEDIAVFERGYMEGERAAYLRLLRLAIEGLRGSAGTASANANAWRLERADTVAKLREMCEEYGCNDWPENLHLADVLEKYLWRALPDVEPNA